MAVDRNRTHDDAGTSRSQADDSLDPDAARSQSYPGAVREGDTLRLRHPRGDQPAAPSRGGATLPEIAQAMKRAEVDWGHVSDQRPPGQPFPLDPEDPVDQRRLGEDWSTEPDRPEGVRLPSAPEQSLLLTGTPERPDGIPAREGLLSGRGDPRRAFPDGWHSDEILYTVFDVARAPEAGLAQCGRDNPLTEDCDPGGGCWLANGDRSHPRQGGPQVMIAAHLDRTGMINAAQTLRDDEIEGHT